MKDKKNFGWARKRRRSRQAAFKETSPEAYDKPVPVPTSNVIGSMRVNLS
jgi:hypothetical protein